jgi:outer membrane protein OmpA-like peptidoglycan-associated protein
LLQHVAAESSVLKDADMISGMLTAIQEFFTDSFTEGGEDLETVDSGRFKLWITYGPKALLVGAVRGTAPVALKDVFRRNLDKIHEVLYAELDTFNQDDLSVFERARRYLQACLLGQTGERTRHPIGRWVILGLLVAAIGVWLVFRARNQARWDHYLDLLRKEPGIAVTRVDKAPPGYVIAGLKDPRAPDPAELLRREGLDPSQVRYEWRPYLSLDAPFVLQRDLDAAAAQVEAQIVRFDVGAPAIAIRDADRVETVAAAIKKLVQSRPDLRIVVTGHTDEVGNPDANATLSRSRAQWVVNALVAQGIPADRLEAVGVGNTQPLRPGGTDWDRAANRSVSFRIAR